MRHVFIDCGVHLGEGTKQMYEAKPDLMDFEWYGFEPNPNLEQYFPPYGMAQFLEKAVWVEDGEIDFFLGPEEDSTGSTLMKKKDSEVNYDNPVLVECVDFSRWLQDNFRADDYIVIKMDIEGAEYPVLYKMIEDGTIRYIDELYVEFHANKVPDFTTTETEELIGKLQEYDLKFNLWH